MLQTGHVIEIVTKLYLVVQNATGRAPNVNVGTEFEANFGDEGVTFTFRAITNSASDGGQGRVVDQIVSRILLSTKFVFEWNVYVLFLPVKI